VAATRITGLLSGTAAEVAVAGAVILQTCLFYRKNISILSSVVAVAAYGCLALRRFAPAKYLICRWYEASNTAGFCACRKHQGAAVRTRC